MEHITFISAGAGSGKTFRLASDLEQILTSESPAKPSSVIGTTFTKLAAGELCERVRQRLNERGYSHIANQMDQALLGTVNSVCGQLLERFAFEAGLSPKLKVIEETEANHLFSLALEQVLDIDTVQTMNSLANRLGQEDWKKGVKDIVSIARSNNQSAKDIQSSGSISADALLVFFPKVSTKDLDKDLYNAVEAAIKFIDEGEDSTAGTKKYLASIKDFVSPIKDKNLVWSNWVKLSKEETMKKSLDASDAVKRVAADFDKHPRLQRDIRDYCESIFEIAGKALEHFQHNKKVRGLIDFTDQEQLLYIALEKPQVQAVLEDELDLLIVDEFQDTSPIQLALFLRLAKLAKKVIWVGDVKQAIYGFRGSDPELMQAILKHLNTHGGKTDVLTTSWRSRPELVHYVNEIFIPAFSNTLTKDKVALNPKPAGKNRVQSNAIEYWEVVGKNSEQALATAKGIQAFIKNDYQLIDKITGEVRNADYGDIAILCKTHDKLDGMAQALMAYDIPISRSQTGLLKTPEAALVLAAIRYLVDPRDSLATAEIISLTQGDTPETWLQSRLEYIENIKNSGAKEGKYVAPQTQWGDDIPLLKTLAEQRTRVQYLTPLEVMAQAIHSADIRTIILGWQKNTQQAKQRLLNIEQCLCFAESYEGQCGNTGQVATVTGLLLWLNQLAKDKEDKQASNTQTDAIQLLTHHGAKGLEWPIVVAMDLDSTIKTSVWGLSVTADNTNLDITQPLKGRQLQYWLWPFGKQATGIAVKDKIEQSDIGQQALKRATEEAKRLLYVSLTRPRDCLIMPMKSDQGEWKNCLGADWMLPEEDNPKEITLPKSNETIPSLYQLLEQKEHPELEVSKKNPPHWFESVTTQTDKLPAKLSPSLVPPLDDSKVIEVIELGERINLQETPEMANLGEAIHALIATQIINNPEDPKALAEQVLQSFAVTEHISVEDGLMCTARFKKFVQEHLKAKYIHVEYPIDYLKPNGQAVSGFIDALVETDEGYIIIDHKSNPQPRSDWNEIALKYSGQLALYKEAIEAVSNKPVLGCWIHFAVTGGVVKVI